MAVPVLVLLLASAAMAELTPGVIVRAGEPFPIVADFNGDGLDDLIQERNVILNNGMLEVQHDLGLPEGERVIAVLDVNGDHRLDLVTISSPTMMPPTLPQQSQSRASTYRLYIADSARNYTAGVDISTGATPFVADVDADGWDDIVLIRNVFEDVRAVAAELTVLRSRGDGTFDRLPAMRIPADPAIAPDSRIPTADMNHDGIPDLVIRCQQDLVVLRGVGGGQFAVEDHYLPQTTEFDTRSMRLADIDDDGNADVILPGFRSIRVFFSDGRGDFTRMATGRAAKLHDVVGFPEGVPVDVDHLNQPRDIAVGNFTEGDRVQVAAGMAEGDIVVFAYDHGSMIEVARTRSDFWLPTVRAGNFRSGDGMDLYVMGTAIWGDMYPRPQVFFGREGSTILSTPVHAPRRRRALRPVAAQMTMKVHIEGDCIDINSARWIFSREGIFGISDAGNEKVEAMFDAPLLYFRLSAPFAKGTVTGSLRESDGVYSGAAGVMTACGWKTMTLTATVE